MCGMVPSEVPVQLWKEGGKVIFRYETEIERVDRMTSVNQVFALFPKRISDYKGNPIGKVVWLETIYQVCLPVEEVCGGYHMIKAYFMDEWSAGEFSKAVKKTL